MNTDITQVEPNIHGGIKYQLDAERIFANEPMDARNKTVRICRV